MPENRSRTLHLHHISAHACVSIAELWPQVPLTSTHAQPARNAKASRVLRPNADVPYQRVSSRPLLALRVAPFLAYRASATYYLQRNTTPPISSTARCAVAAAIHALTPELHTLSDWLERDSLIPYPACRPIASPCALSKRFARRLGHSSCPAHRTLVQLWWLSSSAHRIGAGALAFAAQSDTDAWSRHTRALLRTCACAQTPQSPRKRITIQSTMCRSTSIPTRHRTSVPLVPKPMRPCVIHLSICAVSPKRAPLGTVSTRHLRRAHKPRWRRLFAFGLNDQRLPARKRLFFTRPTSHRYSTPRPRRNFRLSPWMTPQSMDHARISSHFARPSNSGHL